MLNTLKRAALALSCALAATVANAATQTTNYNLNKPQVGADSDQWGTYINGDLDSLDSIIFGIQGTANAACPKAGCTFTGGITGTTASFSSTLGVGGTATLSSNLSVGGTATVGTNSSAGFQAMNGPAGAAKEFTLQTAGVGRWLFGATNEAESGSNAGSNFFIQSDTDAGGFLALPLVINRASGVTTLTGLSVTGTVSLPSSSISSAALANSGVTANTYGDSTHVAQVAVNAKGQVTSATAVAIPSASTSTAGLAALASVAQGQAGTDTTHALTPDALSHNCVPAAGYCQIGPMVIEWGYTGSITAGGNTTVTLPYTCPTASNRSVTITSDAGGTNYGHVVTGTGNFTVYNDKGQPSGYFWQQICY